MHGGSLSVGASPVTQATSVSWTSAGSTVATGAPALPLPLVWPLVLLPGLVAPGPCCPQAASALLYFTSAALPPAAPNPSVAILFCLPPLYCLPPARPSQPCSPAVGPGSSVGHSPAHTSSPARHAHVPVPHRLHGPQMHPAGVCRLLCQQQHLHGQPGQPAPVPMPAWLPGGPLPVP